MAGRKKKDTKKDDLKKGLEKALTPTEGTWKDLEEGTGTLQDGYVDYNGKRFPYKFKMTTWPRMNQITEKLSTIPGISKNSMKYERAKQELMIREIIWEFAGMKMRDDTALHEPIESNWSKLPAPIGEALRIEFFRNTGEIVQQLGMDEEGLMVLKQIIESLFDDNGYLLEDGHVAKKDNALKK